MISETGGQNVMSSLSACMSVHSSFINNFITLFVSIGPLREPTEYNILIKIKI